MYPSQTRLLGAKNTRSRTLGKKNTGMPHVLGRKSGGHQTIRPHGSGRAMVPTAKHYDQKAAATGVEGKLGK